MPWARWWRRRLSFGKVPRRKTHAEWANFAPRVSTLNSTCGSASRCRQHFRWAGFGAGQRTIVRKECRYKKYISAMLQAGRSVDARAGRAIAAHRPRLGAFRRCARARWRDCHVNAGEICGLIGPNGAGKTTLFNCITRLYRRRSGSIASTGRASTRCRRARSSRLGIARTFQNLGIYAGMTVLENVLLGAHHLHGGGFFHDRCATRPSDAEERAMTRMVPLDPAQLDSKSRARPCRQPALWHAQARRDRARACREAAAAVARRAGRRSGSW